MQAPENLFSWFKSLKRRRYILFTASCFPP